MEFLSDYLDLLKHIFSGKAPFFGNYKNEEIEVKWKFWGLHIVAKDFRGKTSYKVRHTGEGDFEYPMLVMVRYPWRLFFRFTSYDSDATALSKLMDDYREKQEEVRKSGQSMIYGFTTSSGVASNAFKRHHYAEISRKLIPKENQHISSEVICYKIKPEDESPNTWGYFINDTITALLKLLKDKTNKKEQTAAYVLSWAADYLRK